MGGEDESEEEWSRLREILKNVLEKILERKGNNLNEAKVMARIKEQ